MKRNFIWISAVLTLIGLLGLASISLAVEDTWIAKTDMPTARFNLSTSVVNGKSYAIGGAIRGGIPPLTTSTVEEYDPATDTWATKTDMPTARSGLSTSVVNGKIYAIGGCLVKPGDGAISTVEEYDPVTDTWTTKADMPTARWGFSTGVVDGKIYAIGGALAGVSGANSGLSTVEEYDPATDTWTTKAHMPTARFGLAAGVVDGRIYAFGGARNCHVPAFSTVEEYDPATDTWTAKADIPTARLYFSASAVGGRIYAFGGAGQATWAPIRNVEEYNPATDTWEPKAHISTARINLSTSAMDGRIYAIGGSVATFPFAPVATVEEYDTGFVPPITNIDSSIISVVATGKLTTTWGKIRADR
jgi:N-acetylneuraminic acid mutarotase